MKLYHCSKGLYENLKRMQARNDKNVPVDELLNGIYFTPNYGFGIAMAVCPDNSGLQIDDNNEKITFDKPELFDPNQDIYVYEIDSEKIPKENLKYVDELQYVVLGIDTLKYDVVKKEKARKVMEYYEITNWKENR